METETSEERRGAELRRLPSVERIAAALPDVPHHLAVDAARAELELAREAIRAGGGAPTLEGRGAVGPGDAPTLAGRDAIRPGGQASALDGRDGIEAGGEAPTLEGREANGGGDEAPVPEALIAAVAARAARAASPSLRRVINATGVVLHTNLGRAPLPAAAVERVAAVAAGYSNLEYDLEAGRRGSRAAHLDDLLREIGGAEAALAVNNNAAAVMLALAALAGEGEVLVGRGQLVEIGGSFRIPDILAQSGATLVEVGTTNRTRLADYEAAIGERTTAILRVHRSNFQIVGFTEEPSGEALAELARERGLAMVDDLGSGALEEVLGEPTVRAAVAAGADVVCCSGDKLLGGPQAGILLGRREAIERCRTHPLARALRLDKMQIAALEATLRAHRDGGPGAVPALAMIGADEEGLRARAERMVAAIGPTASVERESGAPGGGALADVALEGPVCAVDPKAVAAAALGDGPATVGTGEEDGTGAPSADGPAPRRPDADGGGAVNADALVARLREADPPVIARIVRGRMVLDPRTMTDEDADLAAAAVRAALGLPR